MRLQDFVFRILAARIYPVEVNLTLVMLCAIFQVKFAELTLDTFRMMQCLEWEPIGSFYQKHSVESRQNGGLTDNSVTSGLIDMNLMSEITDPNLPPNPKKAVLYRPSVTQFIAVSSRS